MLGGSGRSCRLPEKLTEVEFGRKPEHRYRMLDVATLSVHPVALTEGPTAKLCVTVGDHDVLEDHGHVPLLPPGAVNTSR
jgi:hypothetical protein